MPTFEETVEDALTTVRLVPRWHLDAAEWPLVAGSLTRLAEAIAAGDLRAVHAALGELEDHGPTRLAAIARGATGDAGRQAPPPAIMDVVNTLIHPSHGWGEVSSSQRGSGSSGRG